VLPTDPTFYLVPLALLTLVVSFVQIRKNQTDLSRRKKEIDQKIYETLILREIGERIGYELNMEKILDTIVSSLTKLLPFSVVSYVLTGRDKSKATIRFHLEESVGRGFLDILRDQMLAVLKEGLRPEDLVETITGTIVDDSLKDRPASLWTVPLTINARSVGVLAVASKNNGLYKGPEMEILNKILAQANRAVNNLERVLATEEEKLNSMVSSMADGVLMLDANLNLVVVNPAGAALLGLPVSKKLTIFDIVESLADKVDLRTKIEESQRANQMVTFDNLIVGGRVSQLLISPVRDANQSLLGTVVLFHDITAQKELERIREEFTAMMVHELRAPLTVVRGATDMFLRNPTLPTQTSGQDLLKTMQTSATTMLSLVNDLLDMAKIEAGKFQIVKTRSNLTEILKDRIIFFTQLANPKTIALCEDGVTPDLPVDFDRERISQVLNNLLSNAIKFTPVGGKITLSAYQINGLADIRWRFADAKPASLPTIAGPAVLVAISDTGLGIPPEKITDLFSKFKQLHPSDGDHKGTGLGLVIAKGIVESHGGQIFVQSKVNEGTTFYFTIPA
jgi:two-component system, NtrC family, sensor histidine kinase KinB